MRMQGGNKKYRNKLTVTIRTSDPSSSDVFFRRGKRVVVNWNVAIWLEDILSRCWA